MTQRTTTSVRTEGGLLPQDLLARVAALDSDLTAIKPSTYGLPSSRRLHDAASRAWQWLQGSWIAFQKRRDALHHDAPLIAETRQHWLLPLFYELGYGHLPANPGLSADGRSYPISHAWDRSPIHLLGVGVGLDDRLPGVSGAAKASPHGLVQDFLNRSNDHLWGFVSNGLKLRLLRDHHSLTRQAFVEFDLEAIMEGEQFNDFFLLWLLCHSSRVAAHDANPSNCPLELWVAEAQQQGVRALDDLRNGVEAAIAHLGAGFLAHPHNRALHDALSSGALDTQVYYRQLLRLIYRLIFLFVAEDRDALLDPLASDEARDRFRDFYTTRRARDLARDSRGGNHPDLWRSLSFLMRLLDDGQPLLALPALGGFLWGPDACPHLADADIANHKLLDALRALCFVQRDHNLYPVDWRNIGADELGSVYEGLLELHPRIERDAHTFSLTTAPGHDRKTTGSYYTPTSLVQALLDSALDPVIARARKQKDPQSALLAITVCDPACGSGHFLVAAARRLARNLAQIRSADDEPSPPVLRRAMRDVVGRCIYGVDLNPMAVELCKVSLWMEAVEPGRPLSFLDSHIQRGNALLGATPALIARGLPDDAFNPLTGDDKKIASALKRRNKAERLAWLKKRRAKAQPLHGVHPPQPTLPGLHDVQGSLLSFQGAAPHRPGHHLLLDKARAVDKLLDDDRDALTRKADAWRDLILSDRATHARFLADAWCAAFVAPIRTEDDLDTAITEDLFRRLQDAPALVNDHARLQVRALADKLAFFHWHLAFPQVFGETHDDIDDDDTTGWAGGFDVILGNPPWERVKLQEKEFFAARDPDVANAINSAARKKKITALTDTSPDLWAQWQDALRESDATTHIMRASGRYPLCGRGDINTYAIFAELNRSLTATTGRAGFIVPSGIATDATTQHFFRDLVEAGQLTSMYSFWEIRRIFVDTDSRNSFALLTLVGSTQPTAAAEFAFDLRDLKELNDSTRCFTLSADDIALLNPNTGTCPVFRTRGDAEITKRIYRRMPVLIRDATENRAEENPWGVSFKRLLDMANDSNLFKTRDDLQASGAALHGNTLRDGDRDLLPLYEAKMIHHFDHRFGSYEFQTEAQARQGKLPESTPDQHAQPDFLPLSRYWVEASEVEARLEGRWDRGWLLGWRDICRNSDVRTVIASVIPRVAVNNKFLLMLPTEEPRHALIGCLQSFVFDYTSRQKVGGTSLNYFVMKQLPVLPPSAYEGPCPWDRDRSVGEWLRPYVLELTYTAWDLESFGRDVGWSGPPFRWDEERRFLLRAELDAAFFHLYGVGREDVEHVMESFWIVRGQDIKAHGDYRTKAAILAAFDRMAAAMAGGGAFQTGLAPPPGDPSLAHAASTRPAWSTPPMGASPEGPRCRACGGAAPMDGADLCPRCQHTTT